MRVRFLPRPWNFPAKLILGILSTAGAVYLGLCQGVVGGSRPWEVISVVLTIGVTGMASVRSVIFEKAKENIAKRDRLIQEVLVPAWFQIARDLEVHPELFTISLYWVRGLTRRRKYLFRVQRYCAVTPEDTGIKWTNGKGMVGQAWAENELVARDLRSFTRVHANWAKGRWDDLDEKTRMGMSHQEWKSTCKKYGIIMAVPVKNNGKFVGCISLSTGMDADITTNWTTNETVKKTLRQAARLISITDRNPDE